MAPRCRVPRWRCGTCLYAAGKRRHDPVPRASSRTRHCMR
jgi:hypothetical protein